MFNEREVIYKSKKELGKDRNYATKESLLKESARLSGQSCKPACSCSENTSQLGTGSNT